MTFVPTSPLSSNTCSECHAVTAHGCGFILGLLDLDCVWTLLILLVHHHLPVMYISFIMLRCFHSSPQQVSLMKEWIHWAPALDWLLPFILGPWVNMSGVDWHLLLVSCRCSLGMFMVEVTLHVLLLYSIMILLRSLNAWIPKILSGLLTNPKSNGGVK